MTIKTCMNLVEAMKPGGVDRGVKLRFLGEIEGKVRVELLGEEPCEELNFDLETPVDRELCAPHPYDQLYPLYVMAMMDYVSGDIARYANGAALFNAAYQGYGKWLKRREV